MFTAKANTIEVKMPGLTTEHTVGWDFRAEDSKKIVGLILMG